MSLDRAAFDFEFGLASGLRHEECGTGTDRLCLRMSLWTVRDSAKATASRARRFEKIRAILTAGEIQDGYISESHCRYWGAVMESDC